MRIFHLASSVVLPAVALVLVTVASSTARAAPSAGGKRVAKRAAQAPAVLPAPRVATAPTSAALPPLPPVARDVNAFTITAASAAPVAERSTGGGSAVTGAPVTLASAAPESALPASAPAVSATWAPAAREVITADTDVVPYVKPTGFVLQLGVGGLLPASAFVKGLDTLGPGVSLELRLGYYATPHFGILVGARGSYGHELSGCGSACSAGYSLQAPVMLQFISRDRSRGVYGEIGIGLGTTYGGSIGSSGTYSLSSPVELKSGLGYRFGGAGALASSASIDLNVGVDVGAITGEEVHASGSTYSAKESGPTHVVVAMSAIVHFSM